MKILFLAADFSKGGGISNYTKNLVSCVSSLGHTAEVVELAWPGFFKKIIFTCRFFITLFRTRPDFIFSTHVNFLPLCLTAKRIFGFEYAVSIYGIEVEFINNILHKKSLLAAKFIIYLFESTRERIGKQLPGIEGLFLNIPNSVNIDKFKITVKNLDLVERFGVADSKVIFTLSRLSFSERDNKGYFKVIEALPEILKVEPKAKYILAGTGDDYENVKGLIERLGLQEKVVLAGFVSDEEIVDYYNLSDVFVFPSKKEGFPAIVLLEALACGVPIVGGGQPDALVPLWQEELGIIVPPDDVEKISEALLKILSGNAPKHFYDREFLRRRVIEEYGPDRHRECVKEFLRVIKDEK